MVTNLDKFAEALVQEEKEEVGGEAHTISLHGAHGPFLWTDMQRTQHALCLMEGKCVYSLV